MKNLINDYVYLDGQYLKEEQLVKLALNAGAYVYAEHYLFALLTYGVINGKKDVIHKVNEVRAHYGVKPIPLADDVYDDDDDMDVNERATESDLEAKRLFQKMTREGKREVLRQSMETLITEQHLFKYMRHWYAIFLVVRDRLVGDSLNQTSFLAIAEEITPDALPAKLKIREGTIKNFSREIKEEDRGEVYYKMKSNPQKALCDAFWSIVKKKILTEK